MTALLEGYDLLIVLGIIALLFGGSQLPKLARALGSASHEFKRGTQEGGAIDDASKQVDGKQVDGKEVDGKEVDGKQVEAKEASPT